MRKRNRILGIIFCLTLLFTSIGVGGIFSASAAPAEPTLTMTRGAALRLEELSGLRFEAVVNNYDASKNYGMLITPYDYLEKAGITSLTANEDYVTKLTTAATNKVIPHSPIVAENLTAKDLNGKKVLQYSVTNLLENNYDREFFGIAFIKSETGVYSYAEIDNNKRDIVFLASSALNDYNYNTALDQATKDLYLKNKVLLEKFVTTGVKNVNPSFAYAITGETTVNIKNTLQLSLNVPKNMRIISEWKSSDESIATVDKNGLLTPKKEGAVTITASSSGLYTDTHEVTITEVGDKIDKDIKNLTTFDDNYTMSLNNTDTANIKDGTSSLKYTFTKDNNKKHPSETRGALIKDFEGKLFNSFTVNDWRNTFIGFWVKTPDTRMDLLVRFANTQDGTTYSSIGDDTFQFNRYYGNTAVEASPNWQYVEFSLNALFPQMFTTNVTNIKFCICTEIGSAVGVPVSYYIDGLSIFSKAMVDPMDRDLATLDSNADIVVATNTDKANVKVGESSLKCVFTHNGNNNRSKLLYDYQSQLFNKFTVTNWNNAYIGFWVKTTEARMSMLIRFENSEDGTNYKGNLLEGKYFDFAYNKHQDVEISPEWQYVEFKLSELCTAMGSTMYTGNVTKFRFALCTEITSNATFYIDDFKLFNK